MQPIISVIIATFNAAKTLRNCLESIVEQKNEFIEIIVIDGGSSDGTQTILAEYSSQIDLIISEQDRGIYDAWNKGISHSHGKWIMFNGADDQLEPDAFSNYLVFIDNNATDQVDYICAKINYLGKDGRIQRVRGVPWRWEQFKRSMQVAHVASLHNHRLFQDVGLYNLEFKICGDYELLFRKQERLRCLYLDSCVANMSTGGASYSMRALSEAHNIRRLHSGLSLILLIPLYSYQVLLFMRHRILTTFHLAKNHL